MPPMLLLRCWSISYPREKPLPSSVALYSLTFSFPWCSEIPICSKQWLMTTTWPSTNPCYMAARCPEVSASLSLLHLIFMALQMVLHRPSWWPLLLWTQWIKPLLRCRLTALSPGLLRYLCQWNCHVCGGWFQPHVCSHHHPHLLHCHLYSHSARSFSRREVQVRLYLWVSSYSCHYVLWDTVLDVSEAAFWGICRTDQKFSCFLCLCESYAKPFDLQPSEQRC